MNDMRTNIEMLLSMMYRYNVCNVPVGLVARGVNVTFEVDCSYRRDCSCLFNKV